MEQYDDGGKNVGRGEVSEGRGRKKKAQNHPDNVDLKDYLLQYINPISVPTNTCSHLPKKHCVCGSMHLLMC